MKVTGMPMFTCDPVCDADDQEEFWDAIDVINGVVSDPVIMWFDEVGDFTKWDVTP